MPAVGTPGNLVAALAMVCAACADIGPRDADDPDPSGASDAADAGADREGAPPSVVPRPDGGPAAEASDAAPVAAEPDGVHPTIRSTYALDQEWVYLEWDIVDGTTEYTQFCITDDGPYVYRLEAGAADRGDFLYTYFHRTDICAAFADAGAAAGTHTIWTQVWPGDDSSRAESADTSGTITCP
jgi:hypothetical protein